MNSKTMFASGVVGLAMASALAVGLSAAEIGQAAFASEVPNGVARGMTLPVGAAMAGAPAQVVPGRAGVSGSRAQDGAQQALEGLAQIRQDQCQSGNQLACQALPTIPGIRSQLTQLGQSCDAGDGRACGDYRTLAERIFTAYSESAAVMRQGEAAMAQMNAWRSQMNANAAASMANLNAIGARGQAAHAARQESYAAMNDAWAANQASSDRAQGRFVDGIYEGTTMSGGGVQARIDYGQTGYTDGYGNVVTGPQGGEAPYGYEAMTPTYAAPE